MSPTTDHLIAAEEALDAAREVLPIFERVECDDVRPRKALEALVSWMRGEASVTEVRQAAFDAHEAGLVTPTIWRLGTRPAPAAKPHRSPTWQPTCRTSTAMPRRQRPNNSRLVRDF